MSLMVYINSHCYIFCNCRHGERYRRESPGFNVPDIAPLEETINRLIKNTTGISPTVNVKFPYKNPFLIKEEGLLMPEGDKQIYTIGRRMAKRYPELFPGRFSVADLNFTSSCFLRASQTASAFGLGYLQGKGNVTRKRLQPIPLVTFIPCGDRLNHPVAGCPKWVKTVSTNPDTFIESSKFIKSERFKRVVIKVREKLGLRDVDEVDEQLVRLMFEACAWGIQRAGATDDTEWCSVFDTEDQKVYDYFVDLDFYNIHGPGRQISLDVSCGQLQDIVMNLESMAGRISGKPKSRFVGRFGHLNTIGCLVQKLGLFRDRLPVLADNFEQLRDRNFHIGHIGPMSGNVAVVLFSCSHGEQYRVQFFHNERLIKLPFCHSKVDCSLDEFVNHIKMLLKTCNYDEVCRL